MYSMTEMDFVVWLENEMEKRKLNQNKLAIKGKVSRASINKVMSRGQKFPGPELARGIARGLNLPEEEVFRAAGLLSSKQKTDTQVEELVFLTNRLLDEADKEELIRLAELKLERQEREKGNVPKYRRTAVQHFAIAEPKKPEPD